MDAKTLRRVVLELLVVVFGILIAVGVDRWNQGRQERIAGERYVQALAEDLGADTAYLGRLIRIYHAREGAAQRVLDAMESDATFDGDPAALASDINTAGYVTSFKANDFTYRELLSTGGLGLIEDPDHKRALVAYYQNVEFKAQFNSLWNETPRGFYRPEVRARITPADWVAIETSELGAGGDLLNADATLDALRRDGLVQKLLVSMMTSLRQQVVSHEELLEEAVDLLSLLTGPSR